MIGGRLVGLRGEMNRLSGFITYRMSLQTEQVASKPFDVNLILRDHLSSNLPLLE